MERDDCAQYRDFDLPRENAVRTALQMERVSHLCGFLFTYVEVLY